jgi:DNA-binding response OmpR family regulator
VTSPVILTVEDDEVLSALYTSVLEKNGWGVVIAPTIADADRALREHRVSAVLLDLFLPDGDGRSWLRILRRNPAHANLPVIVVAGSAVVDAQVDFYELGVQTIITKPIAPQVLSAAISAALNRAGAAQPAAAPRPPEAPRPAVVLLAEDDDVVAALVQHRLTREGLKVLRAGDGIAALDVARSTPLGLVILDIMLPGMDGFELLGQLRREEATARVPIIMLTGLGGERDVERALSLGADDYVLKPFSPVELTARVNRLMRARG